MIKLALDKKNNLTIYGLWDEDYFQDPTSDATLISNLRFDSWEEGDYKYYKGKVTDDDLEWILEELKEEGIKFHQNTILKQKLELQKKNKKKFEELIKKGKRIKTSTKFTVNPKSFNSAFKGFYKFQKPVIQHTVDIDHSANFSVPGAGKTLMSYAAYDHLKKEGDVDQLWVIGPKPSFQPWEDEYGKLFDKPIKSNVVRYKGTKLKRIELLSKLDKADVVLVSNELAAGDVKLLSRQWMKSGKKIFLIIDESHHIKSFEQNSRAGVIIELGKVAVKRCILTGTPLPHDWYDLYSQFTFLYPSGEIFGTRSDFENLLLSPDAEKEIGKKINGIWHRVTLNELKKQLPKTYEISVPVRMDKLQQDVYDLIISQIKLMDEGMVREKAAEWKAAKIIRLLQAVTNPRLMLENDSTFNVKKLTGTRENVEVLKTIAKMSKTEISPKIVKAGAIAKDLITGKGTFKEKNQRNVIIYTLFRGNAFILEKILKKYKPLVVTGEFPLEKREERILEFKKWNPAKEKHGRVLIATLGSIAEAVSLHLYREKNGVGRTVCQDVIYLERSYNAGQWIQSLFRVYRIGSKKSKPITYYTLESTTTDNLGTIDHDIDSTLTIRKRRMEELLNDRMQLHKSSFGDEYDVGENKDLMYNFSGEDDLDTILENVKKKKKKITKREKKKSR